MPKLNEVWDFIKQIAPAELAESWDNVGPLVRCQNQSNSIMVCLDITKEVIEEAAQKECGILVSHHPVIFSPLKQMDETMSAWHLVRHNISAVCAHTNLDAAIGGVNDVLAGILGLQDIEEFGSGGRIGNLPQASTPKQLAALCQKTLGSPVRMADATHPVKRVAVVGGSGASFIQDALRAKADCLVTGDADHHDGLDALALGLTLIAAGHHATEQPVVPVLAQKLRQHFTQAQVLVATCSTDPFLDRE
ncbi:MAG: Nif3-like dinuclear metal center hexameric protein [Oscillospiraceae bacterium]